MNICKSTFSTASYFHMLWPKVMFIALGYAQGRTEISFEVEIVEFFEDLYRDSSSEETSWAVINSAGNTALCFIFLFFWSLGDLSSYFKLALLASCSYHHARSWRRDIHTSWIILTNEYHSSSASSKTSHDNVIESLSPASSHRTGRILCFHRESQPADMPPNSNIVIAPILRLRLELCHVSSSESPARSLYVIVNTEVGISVKPSDLTMTIWASDWAVRKSIAMKMSLLSVVDSGTVSVWISSAAIATQRAWRRHDMRSVKRQVASILV